MSWFQSIGQPVRELIQRIEAGPVKVCRMGWGRLGVTIGAVEVSATRYQTLYKTSYEARMVFEGSQVTCNAKEALALWQVLSRLWNAEIDARENATRAAICTHLGVPTTP